MVKSHRLYSLLVLVLLLTSLLAACGEESHVTFTVYEPPTPSITSLVSPALPGSNTTPGDPFGTLDYQPFTSTDGKFSATFPGEPETSNTTLHWISGEAFTQHEFRRLVPLSQNSNVSFIIRYQDFSMDVANSGTPASLLNVGLQSMQKSYNDPMSNIKDIQLGKFPGKAFKMTEGTTFEMYGQIYLNGYRTYHIIVITPSGYDLSKEIKTFFDSFQITQAITDPNLTPFNTAVTAIPTVTPTPAVTPAPADDTKPKDDTVGVALDPAFYQYYRDRLATVFNLEIKYYSSATDPKVIAKIIDAELIQDDGYTSTPINGSNPNLYAYHKAGQPDLLFFCIGAPVDVKDIQEMWDDFDIEANQAAVSDLLEKYKGAKSLVIALDGTGLVDVVNKRLAPTPTP